MAYIKLPSICFLPPQNISILNLAPLQCFAQPTHRCDLCTKEFIRKSSLIRHFRKHTGEKPFECKVCCKSFSRKDIFNKHKQSRKCIARSQNFGIMGNYENKSKEDFLELASSEDDNGTTN